MTEYMEISKKVKLHWDSIAKPIDSLGMLEEFVVKLCSIAGSEQPYIMDKKAVLCLCGDHGVVAEGVTQTDSFVTRIVAENFAAGKSTVNRMSEIAGADVFAVDVGMDCDNYEEKNLVTGAVIDRKIRRGTRNLYKEAAMTRAECEAAIAVGEELVKELASKGYKLIATGEMGIGNTTPTSALAAYFLNIEAEEVTGKGAGLSEEGLCKKCKVVEAAVKRAQGKYGKYETLYHFSEGCNIVKEAGWGDTSDNLNTIEVLAELGGLEIAAMVGVFLGGVKYHLPIMIDGAISAVAALVASRIDEMVTYFAIPSHASEEKTGCMALEAMGLTAMLQGRMCLGEGSGAVALMPLLDMAMKVYATMGSFEDYNIEAYHRF